MTPIIPMRPSPGTRHGLPLRPPPDRAAPAEPPPEPCWREVMAGVFDGTLSPEARLEALMDHIERGRP